MKCYAHLDGDLHLTAEDVEQDLLAYVKLFMVRPAQAAMNPQNSRFGEVLQKAGCQVWYSGGVSLWELRLGPVPETTQNNEAVPFTPVSEHNPIELTKQDMALALDQFLQHAKPIDSKSRGLWFTCLHNDFQTNVLDALAEHHAANHDTFVGYDE